MPEILSPPLKGKKALVLGIANEHSIAYGCARAFRKLVPTWQSPTSTTRRSPTSSRWHASWRRPFSSGWMFRSRASWKPCSTASAGHGDG